MSAREATLLRQEIISIIAEMNTRIDVLAEYVEDDPEARDLRNDFIAYRDRLSDLLDAAEVLS